MENPLTKPSGPPAIKNLASIYLLFFMHHKKADERSQISKLEDFIMPSFDFTCDIRKYDGKQIQQIGDRGFLSKPTVNLQINLPRFRKACS